MENNPTFFKSKLFKGILYAIGMIIVLLITFRLGVFVGNRSAIFSCEWGQNYPGNFFPKPPMNLLQSFDSRDQFHPYGAMGEVVKIDNGSFVVRDGDQVESSVVVSPDTLIERGFDQITLSDLAVGDNVVLFGAPNSSGQIDAKLIRVLPDLDLSQQFSSPQLSSSQQNL